MPSLTTFNANNLFLRYKFTNTYAGDTSEKSLKAAGEVGLVGYLPGVAFDQYPSSFIVWDADRRDLARQALTEPDGTLPDILCFQEVENIHAIRVLNQKHLGGYYTHSLLIDGYDPRNIDVGILSVFPLREVRSHIDETDNAGKRVFSRDCLEVDVELSNTETLHLFINHLKSKYVSRKPNESDASYDNRIKESHQKRLNQAQHVAQYVDSRFAGQHSTALYAVIGDFNDTPHSPWVAPLINSPHLTDLLAKHRPPGDRWTYYWRSKGHVSQIDYVLASAALKNRVASVVQANPAYAPHIERQGLGYRELNNSNQVLPKEATFVHFEADAVTPAPANAPADQKVDFRFSRYQEVMDDWKANTSDHCPVRIWF